MAAAQAAGCALLLTDHLQDGQELGGTLVLDPFHRHPDEIPRLG